MYLYTTSAQPCYLAVQSSWQLLHIIQLPRIASVLPIECYSYRHCLLNNHPERKIFPISCINKLAGNKGTAFVLVLINVYVSFFCGGIKMQMDGQTQKDSFSALYRSQINHWLNFVMCTEAERGILNCRKPPPYAPAYSSYSQLQLNHLSLLWTRLSIQMIHQLAPHSCKG